MEQSNVDWIHLAQDIDQWQIVASTVMNLLVALNYLNFLSSQTTARIQRRTHSVLPITFLNHKQGSYLLEYNAVSSVKSQRCFHRDIFLGLLFYPEDYSPKRHLNFNRIYGVIFEKIQLFVTTLEVVSNHTWIANISTIVSSRHFLSHESSKHSSQLPEGAVNFSYRRAGGDSD
jgi:hypothetical protein